MSKYHIGDTVQLREVTITDVWTGRLGTPFYTLGQGWYIPQDKLDTMINEPVAAPVHGIGDYFPLVSRIVQAKVSKYEGMTTEELLSATCYRGTWCTVGYGRKRDCPMNRYFCYHQYAINYVAAHRDECIAYCEAEDAAQG